MGLFRIYTVAEATGVLTPVTLLNRNAPYNAAPYTVNSSIEAVDDEEAISKAVATAGTYVAIPTDVVRGRLVAAGTAPFDRSEIAAVIGGQET